MSIQFCKDTPVGFRGFYMSLQTPYIPQRGLSRISSLAKPKTHSVGNRDQMKCLQGLIRWMRQKGVGIYICKSECASIACFSAILNRSKEKFENESPGMSLRKHLGTNWNFAVFQKYMCRSSAAISLPLFVNCVQTFWISVPGPGMLQVITKRTLRSWLQLYCWRCPDIQKETTYLRSNMVLKPRQFNIY